MPIEPDRKYVGRVEPGSKLFESKNSGTLGFRVMLSCEDGPTYHDIWLTTNTRERAEKTFIEVLGVKPENLRDGDYLANKLSADITGRAVEFDTGEEEYNGEVRTKVKWLNPIGGGVKPADHARLAHFFMAKVAEPAKDFPRTQTPITDDDIPF